MLSVVGAAVSLCSAAAFIILFPHPKKAAPSTIKQCGKNTENFFHFFFLLCNKAAKTALLRECFDTTIYHILHIIDNGIYGVCRLFCRLFHLCVFFEDDLAAVDITAAAVPTARLTPTVFIAEFILLFIIFSSVL